MDKKVIGLKIKELRSKKSTELGYKYTGEKLANDLGISRSYLGDIESGRTLPSSELIEKLTEIFGVPESYFYNTDLNNNSKENFDSEIILIAKEIKKLPNEKRELLKKLIKSMHDSDKELDK